MNQITFSFSHCFPAEHLFDPGRSNESKGRDDGYRNGNPAQNNSHQFLPVGQAPARSFTSEGHTIPFRILKMKRGASQF